MKYDREQIRHAAIQQCPYDPEINPISADNFCHAFIIGAEWMQEQINGEVREDI